MLCRQKQTVVSAKHLLGCQEDAMKTQVKELHMLCNVLDQGKTLQSLTVVGALSSFFPFPVCKTLSLANKGQSHVTLIISQTYFHKTGSTEVGVSRVNLFCSLVMSSRVHSPLHHSQMLVGSPQDDAGCRHSILPTPCQRQKERSLPCIFS